MFPQSQVDDYRRRAQQNVLSRILSQPRQPLDERLPSGQSVQDLLSARGSDATPRIRPQTPMADVTAAPQATQQPSPRIAVSSQPAVGISGAINLPQPSEVRDPNSTTADMRFPVPEPQSPAIGGSIRGSKLDRDIMLREAMGSADPESKVRVSGDQIDVSPPPMKGALPHRSRFSTAGEAAINALGSADPDRPLYSLGQGIGAAATGLVSPRAGAKLNRRFDTQRLDNDIARGLKLETAQSDLASADALRRQRELEPILQARKIEQDVEYRNAQLDLERQKAAGQIDQREYERRRDALNRQSREGIATADRASREKVAGMRGSGNGEDVRSAKAAAAQQEYDSLIVEERAALEEKVRAYKVLSDARQNPALAKEDIAQIEDAAKQADKDYRSFGDKKREAQRRIRENQVSATGSATNQTYAGRTMSQANLERYAKDKGLSVEDARKQVEAQGVQIQ